MGGRRSSCNYCERRMVLSSCFLWTIKRRSEIPALVQLEMPQVERTICRADWSVCWTTAEDTTTTDGRTFFKMELAAAAASNKKFIFNDYTSGDLGSRV